MKKLLLLSALFIFACSSDDSNDNNGNNVPDGQYFFEIEFADETHRIQGVSSEMLSNGSNNIVIQILNGDMVIAFRLNDITASDYISGQPINFTMIIENPQLQNNNGLITFGTTSYMQDYAAQNNISIDFQASYFVENSPNLTASNAAGLLRKVSNISITDLGTPPSLPSLLDGQNVKGSYQGTLYFRDDDDLDNGGSSQFSVAVPLSISFSAPRLQ